MTHPIRTLALVVVLPVLSSAACRTSPASAPSSSSAPSASASASGASASKVVPPGEAKVGDTSFCLVSKEEFVVNADSPKVEYEGKTYYFCCSGCDKAFQKDPKKYLSK
jgi:YHS domain-containing protein